MKDVAVVKAALAARKIDNLRLAQGQRHQQGAGRSPGC